LLLLLLLLLLCSPVRPWSMLYKRQLHALNAVFAERLHQLAILAVLTRHHHCW
jgi:hypothetical protein